MTHNSSRYLSRFLGSPGLAAGGAVALFAVTLMTACNAHPLKPVFIDKAQVDTEPVRVQKNRDVDLLFMIDNSGSMATYQALLAKNFGNLIAVLEDPEVNANYRIGVTTSSGPVPLCVNFGSPNHNGQLQLKSCVDRPTDFQQKTGAKTDYHQEACLDSCSLTDADLARKATSKAGGVSDDPGENATRAWFERVNGETNLQNPSITGAQAFQCFGPQGVIGCGWEAQLEGTYKALERSSVVGDTNDGFIRPNAALGIVMVSDEVDCSWNGDGGLSLFRTATGSYSCESGGIGDVDGNGTKDDAADVAACKAAKTAFWNAPGAAQAGSDMCWNAGVANSKSCTTVDDCVPESYDVNGNVTADAGAAVLHPVDRYVTKYQDIENVKKDKNASREVEVALIAGLPTGYPGAELTYIPNGADSEFGVNLGCSIGTDPVSGKPKGALPPVRMRAVAEAFYNEISDPDYKGPHTNMFSICEDDYSDALRAIAYALKDQIVPACMIGCVADSDNVPSNGLTPNCTLTETIAGVDTPVDKCALDGAGAPIAPTTNGVCYYEKTADTTQVIDAHCADKGLNLEFDFLRTGPEPSDSNMVATCVLSENPKVDCPDL